MPLEHKLLLNLKLVVSVDFDDSGGRQFSKILEIVGDGAKEGFYFVVDQFDKNSFDNFLPILKRIVHLLSFHDVVSTQNVNYLCAEGEYVVIILILFW